MSGKGDLIEILESIIENVNSCKWSVDSFGCDVSNEIDEWASKISSKDISINVSLKPKPYEIKRIDPLCDDMLDSWRHLLQPPFPWNNMAYNPYYRHCNQLGEHLERNGIDCDVSRSSVGDKSYYNLKFKMNKMNDECSDYAIKKLLDIDNVGLVSFNKINGAYYKTILVDEEELDDKYMCNGDLVFDD